LPAVPVLVGSPSDDLPEVLATGGSGISTVFVSMAARHPEGRDAAYLEWHTVDHRPEQYRLPSLRASLRLVSTPACREARAAGDEHYGVVDHVMSYFFADRSDLQRFVELSDGLRNGGRTPELLPTVEFGLYTVVGRAAAPRIKVGADVLPWWPGRGVYLLVEQGDAPATALCEISGVGGAWRVRGDPAGPAGTSVDTTGLQLTYLFLDGDPVETAHALRPALERRWADAAVMPVLAAPFHTVAPYDWTRHLP